MESRLWEKRNYVSLSYKAGCNGLTKLTFRSLIIDHLSERTERSDDEACVFFYFEYYEPSQPTVSQIITCLLRQMVLAQQKRGETKHIEYQPYGSEVRLTAKEYHNLLMAQAADFRRVYLIIDSLDRCDQESTRNSMLRTITSLPPNMKVLITTRSGSPIGMQLCSEGRHEITIRAHQMDIERYVQDHLDNNGNMRRIIQDGLRYDPNFKEEVINYVLNASQEM